MSGLWEEYEKEKQTTRKNKKETRQTRLGGKRKMYPSGRVGSKCDDPAPTWVRSTNRLCSWHTPRLERLKANQTEIYIQVLLKSIDLLRIVFMRFHWSLWEGYGNVKRRETRKNDDWDKKRTRKRGRRGSRGEKARRDRRRKKLKKSKGKRNIILRRGRKQR